MSLSEFLAELNASGVRLWLEEGTLRYSAPAPGLSDSQRGRLMAARREICELIARAAAHGAPVLEHSPRVRLDAWPLTFEQQRIWRSSRLDPESPAFNVSGQVELVGPLNLPALEQALREVVRRHDVLRSKVIGPDDQCSMVVATDVTVPVLLVDLAEVQHADETLAQLNASAGRRSFDLRGGPPLRATLLRRAVGRHLLILTVHHLVFDHWSAQVLTGELRSLYTAYARGQVSSLQPLQAQFAHFATREQELLRRQQFDAGLAFWDQALRGWQPMLFPVQIHREELAEVGAVEEILNADVLERLRETARRHEAALPVVLVTAFFALLRQYVAQDDVAVGTTVVHRPHPDLETLIGLFINTLMLRCNLSGDPRLGDLLRRMKKSWNDSVAHADVPFQLVLDRMRARGLLELAAFNVGVEIRQVTAGNAADSAAGVSLRLLESSFAAPVRDLTLFLEESAHTLKVRFEYRRAAFLTPTITQLSRRLVRLLRSFPECLSSRIAALCIDEDAGKHPASGISGSQAEEGGTIAEAIAAQARRSPDAIACEALCSNGEPRAVTYAALWGCCTRLSRHLATTARPEAPIAILCDDPVHRCVAALGVMGAGAAALLLDQVPQEQWAGLLHSVGAAGVLVEAATEAHIDSPAHVWKWEELAAAAFTPSAGSLPMIPQRGLACVLAASASEAVGIEHRSLSLAAGMLRAHLGDHAFSRLIAPGTAAASPLLFSFLLPLTCGGTSLLAEDVPMPPAVLRNAEPTSVYVTPETFASMLEAGALPSSVQTAFVSGGILHEDTLNLAFSSAHVERVVKCYGRIEGALVQGCAEMVRVQERRAPGEKPVLRSGNETAASDMQCATAVLGKTDRQRVLENFNATRISFPGPVLLHELVEQQVAMTPDAVAVECEDGALSYSELEERGNLLAHYLRNRGVGPDVLVAVCVERSLEMVIGLLGILKAGGAYVPLDADYPLERLQYLLQDAAPSLLLTQTHLRGRLPAAAAPVIELDGQWSQIAAGGRRTPPRVIGLTAAHLAYMIYTSGSTGQPKGAMNEHRAVVNRLQWMQHRYGLRKGEGVLHKTPLGFDVSVWEVFWPLLCGARLVMARPGGHQDPQYLRQLIRSSGVTRAHFVPAMLSVFLRGDMRECLGLTHIVCSGEELTAGLRDECLTKLPQVQLSNLYGPTEAAVDVTSWECRPGEIGTVPIGAPIANVRIYVLDERREPLPIGATGEIYIGGVAVGRGYWRRAELTAHRFLEDPFAGDGGRMYRTGDLGRWRKDGCLEYLGRNDDQVKVRGYRIELGEIQAQLLRHEQVREAVVVAQTQASGEKRLVAYVTSAAAKAPSLAELRAHSMRVLPHYMVPAAFVVMERLPLTAHGKIDRKRLPSPDITAPRARSYVVRQPDGWPAGDAVPAASLVAPIGHSLGDALHLVLEEGYPAPTGIRGRIAISGPLLARGYVGRADLTAARFRPDPAAAVSGSRAHLTDDVGYIGRDGLLYPGGNATGQTRIHGRHVDLAQVEAALRMHGQVRAAIASIGVNSAGRRSLVAQVMLATGATADVEDIRYHIAGILPDYMVPETVVRVDELPRKRDGSIDRDKVPAPVVQQRPEARTRTERVLAKVWEDVLHTQVSVERSFFELGGNSLSLLSAAALASERLGQEVTATDILRHVTIRRLALHLVSAVQPAVAVTHSVQRRVAARLRAIESAAARARDALT